LYGQRAPIVEALVLNRRAAMEPRLREAYAEAGLIHLLSISGFHVGLLAGWVFLLARALGCLRPRALALSALASVGYVAFLGWPAPATRAAGLTVVVAASAVRQRRVEPDPLLAVTSLLVLLLDPWALMDLGAWLSASALWGATRFSRWSDLRLGTGFGWRTLAASVGATLATAPLTAAVLGTVSLAGIGLNFVAIPLAAVAVPGVLASLVVAPFGAPASALAAGAGLGLAGLDQLARLGAWIPGGHVVVAAEPVSALPWIVALGIALWGMGRRNAMPVALLRWSAGAALAVWGALALWVAPVSGDAASSLTLHFLSVGQGDGPRRCGAPSRGALSSSVRGASPCGRNRFARPRRSPGWGGGRARALSYRPGAGAG
jgi:competence protein ComEC